MLLKKSKIKAFSRLQITGSKSESNRALLLQALYNGLTIQNLSNSDDSKLMKNALSSKATNIDIHHAGTAMRFLTAYFARVENPNFVRIYNKYHEKGLEIIKRLFF